MNVDGIAGGGFYVPKSKKLFEKCPGEGSIAWRAARGLVAHKLEAALGNGKRKYSPEIELSAHGIDSLRRVTAKPCEILHQGMVASGICINNENVLASTCV